MRDQMDTLPCHIPRNQYITFVFSQQPNARSSFFNLLFRPHRREHGEIVPIQASRTQVEQWHRVIIQITKTVLPYDVELDETGDYLNRMDLNKTISNILLLSPEKINYLLEAGTRNFLHAKGRARAVSSGILFARKLHKGEKLYACIFSLTPQENK